MWRGNVIGFQSFSLVDFVCIPGRGVGGWVISTMMTNKEDDDNGNINKDDFDEDFDTDA